MMQRVVKMAEVFGLSPVLRLSQFESFGNENWLYEGVDGRRSVLRRYQHGSLERVLFQLELQAYLKVNGFPVAALLPPLAGGLYEVDAQGYSWAAFDYVEGHAYDFSLLEAELAAEALARFHVLGGQFCLDAPRLEHRPPLRECWVHARENLDRLQQLFSGAKVDKELSYLGQWWEEVLVEWPVERLGALPSALVHDDFHGKNLAYTEESLAGVFDFDDVETGPLVQDVAMALYKFGRESRFSLRLRPKVVSDFLKAYRDVRPLNAEELLALPVLLAMQYPLNPAYYRYYRDHYGSDIERRLRREVTTMQALKRQLEQLPL